MKYAKILISASLFALVLSGMAMANEPYIDDYALDYDGIAPHDLVNYGITGNSMMLRSSGGYMKHKTITPVTQVMEMEEDDIVIMRGYLIKQISAKNYEFKDDTGKVVVIIDDNRWVGQYVSPEDLVELRGAVDTHRSKPSTIDVQRVTKLSSAMPPMKK